MMHFFLKKTSPNYGSIKIHFNKQRTEPWRIIIVWHTENLKECKKFRPMSACADCAGWHGSILFANAFSLHFTELRYTSFYPCKGCMYTCTLYLKINSPGSEVWKSSELPRGSVVNCLTRNPGVLGSYGSFLWECPWARHFKAKA